MGGVAAVLISSACSPRSMANARPGHPWTRKPAALVATLPVIVSPAPVGIGLETGTELLKAAATLLIGGQLTSTLRTLVFVQAMYTISTTWNSHSFARSDVPRR